jgi:hypothetical protein
MKTLALFDAQDRFLNFLEGEISDHAPIPVSDSGLLCIIEVPAPIAYDAATSDIVFTRDGWQVIPRLNNPVPASVPAWRIKAVADINGLTQSIESFLQNLPLEIKPAAVRAWTDGNIVERHSSTTLAVQAHLKLNDSQVDDWFRQAANLNV